VPACACLLFVSDFVCSQRHSAGHPMLPLVSPISCAWACCRTARALKEWRVTVKKMSLKQRDLAGVIVTVRLLLHDLKPPKTEKQNVRKVAGEGQGAEPDESTSFARFTGPAHGGCPGCAQQQMDKGCVRSECWCLSTKMFVCFISFASEVHHSPPPPLGAGVRWWNLTACSDAL